MTAHVPDHLPIQAEPAENRNRDAHADDKGRPEVRNRRIELTQPQGEGTPERHRQHKSVRCDGDGLLLTS